MSRRLQTPPTVQQISALLQTAGVQPIFTLDASDSMDYTGEIALPPVAAGVQELQSSDIRIETGINQELGSGFFAQVYSARLNNGQQVAVKVFKLHDFSDEQLLKRAKNEADLQLRCWENCNTVFAGITGFVRWTTEQGMKTWAIVMEHCCCSLWNCLEHLQSKQQDSQRQQTQLSQQQNCVLGSGVMTADALQQLAASNQAKQQWEVQQKQLTDSLEHLHGRLGVLADVAEAMRHMHEGLQGFSVLHNDLRSENILLTFPTCRPGQPLQPVAKVADFGLAVRVDHLQQQQQQSVTALIAHVTNPLWVAPEVYKSASQGRYCVSLKTDIFSFGHTTWEVLSGLKPYEISAPEDRTILSNWVKDQLGKAVRNIAPLTLRKYQRHHNHHQQQQQQRQRQSLHVPLACPTFGNTIPDVIADELVDRFDSCCSWESALRPSARDLSRDFRDFAQAVAKACQSGASAYSTVGAETALSAGQAGCTLGALRSGRQCTEPTPTLARAAGVASSDVSAAAHTEQNLQQLYKDADAAATWHCSTSAADVAAKSAGNPLAAATAASRAGAVAAWPAASACDCSTIKDQTLRQRDPGSTPFLYHEPLSPRYTGCSPELMSKLTVSCGSEGCGTPHMERSLTCTSDSAASMQQEGAHKHEDKVPSSSTAPVV